MKMKWIHVLLGVLLVGLSACRHNEMSDIKKVTYYTNPVVPYSLPDPTILQEDDQFYLFATEDIHNVPILRSSDLIHWTEIGTAFTDATRPTFEPGGGIWAPDINKIGKKYVMYYSMSKWGGEWTCGIGVASADKPEGPYTDHGMLFRSNGIGVQNCIDPCFIHEKNKNFLFFGSFHGIYFVELSNDGLSVLPGETPLQVAGNAYEGTYIHKRGNYYYMFASIGTCCEGTRSTYTTVVARSENLFGPYMDKNGNRMMDNNHEILIHKNNVFVGTGHNSEIVTDKRGNDWIFYHAFEASNAKKGRVLMMDRIIWEDGWPKVEGSVPALQAIAPSF